MSDKRLEQRLLCADLIEVEWKDRSGWPRTTAAVLEDISRSGACVQTDVPVPLRALVTMHHGTKTLEGTVRYCTFREIGYFVGLAFSEDSRWSQRIFKPKHTVDPQKLRLAASARGA